MNYSEITSLKQLANFLRCDADFLEKAINYEYSIIDDKNETEEINSDIIVERLYIKKKGRATGYRVVFEVKTFQLANTLKILNNHLNKIYTPPHFIHGFVSGKNVKTNASAHINKKEVLSVDIKDFFDTINDVMITEALINLGFNKQIAKYISSITTINGHLVQGFNTSPTIANLVALPMDEKLLLLCDNSAIYTRYADDLYFSTNTKLPTIESIEDIVTSFGFSLNHKKTKQMSRGKKQFVTGLTVFDNKYPRIPKIIKRNLRLELHYLEKYGFKNHAINRLKMSGLDMHNINNYQYEIQEEIKKIQNRIFGWIYYINSIEPKVAKRFLGKIKIAKN